nr:ATP-binding protein [Pseudonocardia sp. C8]
MLRSLLAAVEAAPGDVPLRLHVADMLARSGRAGEALPHVSAALAAAPGDPDGLALLQRVTAELAGGAAAPAEGPADGPAAPAGGSPGSGRAATPSGPEPDPPGPAPFDWDRAEDEFAGLEPAPLQEVPSGAGDLGETSRPGLRLADVAGMEHVKERLELQFLGPARNPELAKAFGSRTSGGLLLYGPPGCGKTFLARAVAGELGAAFTEIGIADVLDMWIGRSERNLADLFAAARSRAPCVLFLDEVDALGQKRAHLSHSGGLRNTVNQLLSEMDSWAERNEGVYVLGATNHPWDMDPALRRPGRFDRMLLVLPPDAPARAGVLRHHLRDRPTGELDLDKVVRATEHFSGADLAHVVDTAAERAMAASVRDGRIRPLSTRDLLRAAKETGPSTGPWFATARNVALFGNVDGSYDELAAYLKRNRKL